MNTIVAVDYQLFFVINHLPHTAFTNTVALFFSGIGGFGIIWFLIGTVLFLREEQKDHWFFAPIVTGIIASWGIVELYLKPFIARMRPEAISGAIVIQKAIQGFSFPSGHATISWAMMVILSHYEPRWSKWFVFLALLISLSRIYLGVHYPTDVIVGGLVGWSIGTITLTVIKHPHRSPKAR